MPKLPSGLEKRGNQYWTNIRVDGRRIRQSVGSSLPRAKECLLVIRADAARGKLPTAKNIRLVEAWKLYLETTTDKKSAPNYRHMGKAWCDRLGDP